MQKTQQDLFINNIAHSFNLIPGCIPMIISQLPSKAGEALPFEDFAKLSAGNSSYQDMISNLLQNHLKNIGTDFRKIGAIRQELDDTFVKYAHSDHCPYMGRFNECHCCIRCHEQDLKLCIVIGALLVNANILRCLKTNMPSFLAYPVTKSCLLATCGISDFSLYNDDGTSAPIFLNAVNSVLNGDFNDYASALQDQIFLLLGPEGSSLKSVHSFILNIPTILNEHQGLFQQDYAKLRSTILSSCLTNHQNLMYPATLEVKMHILSSKDSPLWDQLLSFASVNGYICMEPYCKQSEGITQRGLVVFCNHYLLIPENCIYLLSALIKKVTIVTSYIAPLLNVLHYPSNGFVFFSSETDTCKYTQMRLKPGSFFSIIRHFSPDKSGSSAEAVRSVALGLGIDTEKRQDIFSMMKYYPLIFNILRRKFRNSPSDIKMLETFDILAGYSYFIPDEHGLQAETLFTLKADFSYDFMNTELLSSTSQLPGDHTPSQPCFSIKLPQCCWFFISEIAGHDICSCVIRHIVEHAYHYKYDIHMLYFGQIDDLHHYQLGLLAPFKYHDICYDILVHAASCDAAQTNEGLYEIKSGIIT